MSTPDGSQDWVAAGFEALAAGGVERVRVEVLAQSLGVTKGGFYRRFRDRPALLEAMLEAWATGRIAVIRQQTELGDDETAEARVRSVVRLFSERLNAQGLSIEIAIRQWARSDAGAAAVVSRVDAVRLASVTELYARMGHDPATAQARGFIFYAFVFGQTLLLPEASQAERDALVTASADIIAGATGPGR
jgi:AcrR family transcriptional regulator